VVIDDLDFVGISILPSETESVLVIDSNAVLPESRPTQRLQPISRWDRQLPQVAHPVQLGQLASGNGPQRRRTRCTSTPRVGTIEDVFCARIGERAYHGIYYNAIRIEYASCRRTIKAAGVLLAPVAMQPLILEALSITATT
jgi:hypothetical protein